MQKVTREENVCCFCGKPYEMYGNNTWGCWSPIDNYRLIPCKMKCCNACNESIVVPQRAENDYYRKKEFEEKKALF